MTDNFSYLYLELIERWRYTILLDHLLRPMGAVNRSRQGKVRIQFSSGLPSSMLSSQMSLPPPQAFHIFFFLSAKERLGDWERTKGRERELVVSEEFE